MIAPKNPMKSCGGSKWLASTLERGGGRNDRASDRVARAALRGALHDAFGRMRLFDRADAHADRRQTVVLDDVAHPLRDALGIGFTYSGDDCRKRFVAVAREDVGAIAAASRAQVGDPAHHGVTGHAPVAR